MNSPATQFGFCCLVQWCRGSYRLCWVLNSFNFRFACVVAWEKQLIIINICWPACQVIGGCLLWLYLSARTYLFVVRRIYRTTKIWRFWRKGINIQFLTPVFRVPSEAKKETQQVHTLKFYLTWIPQLLKMVVCKSKFLLDNGSLDCTCHAFYDICCCITDVFGWWVSTILWFSGTDLKPSQFLMFQGVGWNHQGVGHSCWLLVGYSTNSEGTHQEFAFLWQPTKDNKAIRRRKDMGLAHQSHWWFSPKNRISSSKSKRSLSCEPCMWEDTRWADVLE